MKQDVLKKITTWFAICLLCFSLFSCGEVPAPAGGSEDGEISNERSEKIEKSEEGEADLPPDCPGDPTWYTYHSLREIANVYAARKEASGGGAGTSGEGKVLLDSEGDEDILFNCFGDLPFPVLGKEMPLAGVEFAPYGWDGTPELHILYQNSTGDFIRFGVCPNFSVQAYVEKNYPDTACLAVRNFAGRTVFFYLRADHAGDLRAMRGVFEIDGTAVVITCGRYPCENPEEISFDGLTAPLEHLTVSTLFEQIGVK